MFFTWLNLFNNGVLLVLSNKFLSLRRLLGSQPFKYHILGIFIQVDSTDLQITLSVPSSKEFPLIQQGGTLLPKYIIQLVPEQEVAQICKLPHKFSFSPIIQSFSWFFLLPGNRCITHSWSPLSSVLEVLIDSWTSSGHALMVSWSRDLRFVHCLLCLLLISKTVWWVWSDPYISGANVPWGTAGSVWVPCWRSWLGKLVTSPLAPLAWSLVLNPAGQPLHGFLRQRSHGHTPAPRYWWGIYLHSLWEGWRVLSTPPTFALWKGWRQFLLSIWLTSPLLFPNTTYKIPYWTRGSCEWP